MSRRSRSPYEDYSGVKLPELIELMNNHLVPVLESRGSYIERAELIRVINHAVGFLQDLESCLDYYGSIDDYDHQLNRSR